MEPRQNPPKWLASHVSGTSVFEFEGDLYRVFLVRPSLEPELTGVMIGFAVPRGEEPFLLVSETMPLDLFNLAAWHEIAERMVFGECAHPCLCALLGEMRRVDPANRERHFHTRKATFACLDWYYRAHPERASAGQPAEIAHSLCLLNLMGHLTDEQRLSLLPPAETEPHGYLAHLIEALKEIARTTKTAWIQAHTLEIAGRIEAPTA